MCWEKVEWAERSLTYDLSSTKCFVLGGIKAPPPPPPREGEGLKNRTTYLSFSCRYVLQKKSVKETLMKRTSKLSPEVYVTVLLSDSVRLHLHSVFEKLEQTADRSI